MNATVRFDSQRVAWSYFAAAAALFVLQVVFGLLMASQYVWPSFLMDTMPFNTMRATHLNLLVFWLLLGLMGAAYYLIPDETGSELFSVALARIQLAVLLVAGVGALSSMWFLHQSMGKPFTEAPLPWPWLVAAGAVLFLVNVGATIARAPRRTAVAIVLLAGMTGLAALYPLDLVFFANLTVDYYWWFWIIHLWVEGTWEMIAAAITAYLLMRLTGVERGRVSRWLYVLVGLTLFTGIIGIGHHYYWIGTPAYWQVWGGAFGALEPIPIALMVYDALTNMRHRRTEPMNRVAWYFLGGAAIAHFVGAGVWGFAINLPATNRWTHGTLVTAAHGHFAFFGAFAMLVLASVYAIVPALRARPRIAERRGLWAFWLMLIGMVSMVTAFTIAGLVQVYLWRMIGLDFMTVRTQYVAFWMFWVWFFGLTLFLPGVLVYLWDFLVLSRRLPPGEGEGVPAPARS
jgi:nitric oxide reductase subunit B